MTSTSKKYWFSAKRYGWGWVPITWQGWGITIAYVIATASLFQPLDFSTGLAFNILGSKILAGSVLTVFLLTICYLSGEKPRWRWG